MLLFFRSFFKSKFGLAITFAFLALIAFAFASSDVANTGMFGGVAGGERVAVVGDERIDSAELAQSASTALDRLRQEPTGASCVWFGVNRQAPHTQCFLFGSGAEGAAAARPVSLKRMVDELCGVPGSGRPKKRKRQPS